MGHFSVLDKEPDYASLPAERGMPSPSVQPSASSSAEFALVGDNAGLSDPSYTWEEPLDEVRSRLERLLAVKDDGQSPKP